MRLNGKKIIFALMLMGLGAGWSLAAPGQGPEGKTIQVDGVGVVTAQPDEAILQLTLQQEGASLGYLIAQVKTQTTHVLSSLESFDIPEKDLQTVEYSINRKYQYTHGESHWVGYIVTNQIKVVLKDLSKLGEVLGALSDQNNIQMEGPTFDFSNPKALQLRALKAAVENAHAKAMVLAQAAGVRLRSVYSIDQTHMNMPVRPVMMAMAMGGSNTNSSGAVPVENGTNQVTAQIQVIYALK